MDAGPDGRPEGRPGSATDATAADTAAPSAAAAERAAERAEAAEDVLLMVSELVTNACMHAGGPRELVLRHMVDGLRVEVSDGSPEHPRRRPATDPALPGGHGLTVLERLARKWGSVPSTGAWGGKTVWLEVDSPLTSDPWRPGPSAARSAVSPESG
ncbi:ATP-binding protein [Streptomyces sp. WAC06614]|nr:ATP-binding protein [Streptomyces sp. WAC06614]